MAFWGEERGTRCEFFKLDKQTGIVMLLDSRKLEGRLSFYFIKLATLQDTTCGNDKFLDIRYQMI